MIRVNIHEAKTNLSKLIERAEKGEVVIVCRRNEPVAELRATPGGQAQRRVFGGARGKVKIPPAFFEPLPDDELSRWEGAGE